LHTKRERLPPTAQKEREERERGAPHARPPRTKRETETREMPAIQPHTDRARDSDALTQERERERETPTRKEKTRRWREESDHT
jgi:hypothetical protein